MHQYKDLISLYCLYANFDKEVSRYRMYLGNSNKIKLLQYNVKKNTFQLFRYCFGKPGIPWNMIFIVGKKFVC